MSSDDAAFESELRSLLSSGRKIEAIKLYRERTGVGLAEAKSAVEALQVQPVDSPDLETQIVSLLQQDQKIQAIKFYRERTGVGLKEAKDAVEAIAAERGALASKSGCLGMVLILIGICAWLFVKTENRF